MFFIKTDDIKIETYLCEFGFRMEIVEKTDTFECWIYHSNYGIKDLMFGGKKADTTKEDFIELAKANYIDYLKGYIDDYCSDYV